MQRAHRRFVSYNGGIYEVRLRHICDILGMRVYMAGPDHPLTLVRKIRALHLFRPFGDSECRMREQTRANNLGSWKETLAPGYLIISYSCRGVWGFPDARLQPPE